MSSATEKHYHILLNSPQATQPDSHANLDSGFWKTPVDIDDADLTFDGKPLNLLHEENQSRWMLENHVFERTAGTEEDARGRRRHVEDRRGEVSQSFFLWSFPPKGEGS
jgi:hypothetical protein